MSDIELKSFPFDSMDTLNEDSGQMEPDREYEAEFFRKYFAKFLSNGVYLGHYKNYGDNSMKVSLDTGLTIKVAKGAGIIEGADYENENDQLITLERPVAGTRIDRVVVQMNASLDTRASKLIIKQGDGTTPAELTRTENIYEICIAEVTVRSTTNLTDNDIRDTRFDTDLCGIVNSLISISGDEIVAEFREYVDSVASNLVRKDQSSVINGTITDNNGGTSKNNFTDVYRDKLDGIANNANNYSLPTATGNTLGGVKVGSNINFVNGVISLIKANIIAALGYTPPTTNTTYGVATQSANGLMSATDKSKLDGIASGANKTVVDSSMSSSSTNPVQNKVVNTAINNAVSGCMPKSGGTFTGTTQWGGDKYTRIDATNGNIKSLYILENSTSSAPNLNIGGTGSFYHSTSSSKRYKKNITQKLEERLNPEALYDLPIVQYQYKVGHLGKKDKRYGENFIGFIAEDVKEIYEPAVDYNEDGTVEMWNYKVMIPAMLKLIQDQHKEIEELKALVKGE